MSFSEVQPAMSGFPVWSSTVMHSFQPYSATWSSGTVTVVFKNHGLATSDSVTIACKDTTSAWHIGAKTVTVVDKDTFTFALVGDPGVFPNSDPYPANYVEKRVTITCSKYSREFYKGAFIQIESLGTAASMKLQVKLAADAPWVDTTQTALAVGVTKVTDLHNFMRLVGATVPNNTVKVYVQGSQS